MSAYAISFMNTTVKRPILPVSLALRMELSWMAAEAAGFKVIVTVDQHILDQQSLAHGQISLVACAVKPIACRI